MRKTDEAREEILTELFKVGVHGANDNAYIRVLHLLDSLKKSNPEVLSKRFSLHQLARALETCSEVWEERITTYISTPEEE